MSSSSSHCTPFTILFFFPISKKKIKIKINKIKFKPKIEKSWKTSLYNIYSLLLNLFNRIYSVKSLEHGNLKPE